MNLLVGTSGYSYKEWKGGFYPEDLPGNLVTRLRSDGSFLLRGVIVGAYDYDNGEADEGRVFVYYGSSPSGLDQGGTRRDRGRCRPSADHCRSRRRADHRRYL